MNSPQQETLQGQKVDEQLPTPEGSWGGNQRELMGRVPYWDNENILKLAVESVA